LDKETRWKAKERTVEAFHYGYQSAPEWFTAAEQKGDVRRVDGNDLEINSFNPYMPLTVAYGDYILLHSTGILYSMSEESFLATYDWVDNIKDAGIEAERLADHHVVKLHLKNPLTYLYMYDQEGERVASVQLYLTEDYDQIVDHWTDGYSLSINILRYCENTKVELTEFIKKHIPRGTKTKGSVWNRPYFIDEGYTEENWLQAIKFFEREEDGR
jgi:hypothetical protein